MSFRSLVIALTSVLLFSLVPGRADAQLTGGVTITVNNETSLPRLDKNGNTINKRELTLTPEGVNYQDCLDDQQIDFPIVLSGTIQAGSSFEAWAGISGADCGVQTNRTSASAVCWPLVTGIPLQTTVEVRIPVRKILSGAPPFTTQNLAQGADMCGKVDLVTVSVQFLYFAPGSAGSTPTATHATSVSADTLGPLAPTGLSVLPGNTRIKVSWDNISGEGGVSALTGVSVYCDPSTGTAAASTDAGTTQVCADGGTDEAGTPIDAGCTEVPNEAGTTSEGGTIATGGCSTPDFQRSDGTTVIPDATFNSKYQCGSITGNTGTSVIADSVQGHPLVNGTNYAVSVAGTDAYGNVGPLSTPICETPEITTDFWDAYKDAGGGAGGGFCATAGDGMPAGSFALFGLGTFVMISVMTRRMKRR